MKIQINSDNSIDVTPKLTRFIKDDAHRVLGRFDAKLTRVELHLSDVNKDKSGPADKRCLIEVRPTSGNPLTTTANADTVQASITESLGKMQRLLSSFFGRKGRSAKDVPPPEELPATPTPTPPASKKTPAKKAAAKKPTKLSSRGPKKTPISQARRKAQPSR